MSLSLEYKKLKRTGFILAFIVGGLLSSSIPIVNMAVRSQMYIGIDSSPIQILMDANWQMMTMLNILLLVIGSCLMYQAEYSDNAIQKMRMLPIKEHQLFFNKTILLTLMGALILILEAISITFCSIHWFDISNNFMLEIVKNFVYAFILIMPSILLSMFIASLCTNMWVSLGIGIICVFIATLLPLDNFVLSIFPFAMPFQTLIGSAENTIRNMIIASITETIIIAIIEVSLLKARRSME